MNLAQLSAIASDEAKAVEFVERLRWPNGSVCPHCDNAENKPQYNLGKTRLGLHKCGACRKQYTVRVGSIFENSPIPLGKSDSCDPSNVQQQEGH